MSAAMIPAVIYARYSTDMQSASSVEDQIRLCAERVEREGMGVTQHYADHGISGASLMRPGIQQLLQDAMAGKFQVVFAEALDRISRDQEDIAGVFKRLSFAGVQIVTLSEGLISELHIGLKGTMNALFLKDLSDKTRRGLRVRVERSGQGLSSSKRQRSRPNELSLLRRSASRAAPRHPNAASAACQKKALQQSEYLLVRLPGSILPTE